MRTVLISAVVGMGILIVIGIIALIYGLIQKADNPDFKFFDLSGTTETQQSMVKTPEPPLADGPTQPDPVTVSTHNPLRAFGDLRLTLPTGYSVVDAELDGPRLLVRLQNAANQTRLMFIDMTTGGTLGTLEFNAAAPAQ